MELQIYHLVLIAFISLGGSYVQSVTGFGYGIFVMMFYPLILAYTESNILSTLISVFTSLWLVITLFRKIHWKNIIFTLIGSFFTTYFAVEFVKMQTNTVLTLILGAVLLLLSIYFMFFSDKIHIKPTWYAGLIAGITSGIMGGMFSMGGPPVVIYYLHSEKDQENYLATLSAYFVISDIFSIIMKVSAGFVTKNVLISSIFAATGLIFGIVLGHITRKKMNAKLLKKAIYAVMMLSGIFNIVTSII